MYTIKFRYFNLLQAYDQLKVGKVAEGNVILPFCFFHGRRLKSYQLQCLNITRIRYSSRYIVPAQ